MAADESALGALHNQVAEVLSSMLRGTDLPTGEFDDAGAEIVQVAPPASNLIVAAIQFLKNNNITCTPSKDNALGELEGIMAARAAKAAAAKASRADLIAATEATQFAQGLPN